MSERKMSSGYIDGKSFSRKRFFEGKAYKSDAQMPMIDTVLLTEWSSVMQHRPSAYNPQADEAMLLRSHFTFYDDKTNYWFSDQSIVLDNTLTGNLVIHSGVSIHITSAARLNNVIVMAPEIILDENVEASVQCMATKIIRVGRNSRLLYPSSLVLDGGENDSTIVMEQGATLQGIVLIPGSDRIVGSKASFRLEKGAVLHGMAYVNGAADISGSIFGHITAKRFQTTLDKVVYGNHLLDAVIDADKRSIYMPGTFVWGDSSHLIIAKWIER